MKKIIVLLCATLLIIALVGCSSDELNQQVYDLSNQVSSLTDQLDHHTTTNAAQATQIDSLRGELDTVSALLENATLEQIPALQDLIDSLKAEIQDLLAAAHENVYIYWVMDTHSTLYAILHMLNHSSPAYVSMEREATFDPERFPDNITLLNSGLLSNIDYQARIDLVHLLQQTIEDVIERYNDPNIHIFIDAHRPLVAFYAIIRAGLELDDVTITLLSQGANDARFLVGPDGPTVWEEEYAHMNGWIDAIRQPDFSLDSENIWSFWHQNSMPYMVAQMTNVSYWIQFPEIYFLREGIEAAVTANLLRVNFRKIRPFNMFAVMCEPQQQLFIDGTIGNPAFAVDGITSLVDYLTNIFEGDKPVMIISGTHDGSFVHRPDFYDAVVAIHEKFGDDFILTYKPHPRWDATLPGNAPTVALLNELSIRILPAQLPMEVLLWVFPDVTIGGYSSSLYMSAGPDQVFFSIGGSLAGASELLQLLIDFGFFPNLKYEF